MLKEKGGPRKIMHCILQNPPAPPPLSINNDRSLRRPNLKNIIIGTIYRPPNCDAQLFVSKLDELLNKFFKENKTSYLMGDFNIDLLKYQEHNLTSDFLDTMFSHFFLSLINRPHILLLKLTIFSQMDLLCIINL